MKIWWIWVEGLPSHNSTEHHDCSPPGSQETKGHNSGSGVGTCMTQTADAVRQTEKSIRYKSQPWSQVLSMKMADFTGGRSVALTLYIRGSDVTLDGLVP